MATLAPLDEQRWARIASALGIATTIALGGSYPAAAADRVSVMRPPSAPAVAQWYLDLNGDPASEVDLGFGLAGDVPLVGDWDGSGRDHPGVARSDPAPEDFYWHFYLDTDGDASHEREVVFGFSKPVLGLEHADVPLAGDWDGDGDDDPGVARSSPDDPYWHFYLDTDGDPEAEREVIFGFSQAVFGLSQRDVPVVGDWDGDGDDDPGVAREDGDYFHWYLGTNGDAGAERDLVFGFSKAAFGLPQADVPVVGDWDGDGDDDPGVARREFDAYWHWYLDTDGDPEFESSQVFGFSQPAYGNPVADVPVVGRFELPELTVEGVSDGQSVPIEFTSHGETKSFTARNDGNAPLVLGPITAPAGFRVIDDLATTLAPGASDAFAIQVDADPDVATGTVSFASNDGNENPFTFAVTGQPRRRLVRDGARLSVDGHGVRLVGYGDYGMLTEAGFDAPAFFATLDAYGCNLVRVWANYHFTNSLSPFRRDPLSALDRPSYYLLQPDDAFYAQLRRFVATAARSGVVVQLVLFDSVAFETSSANRWGWFPYNDDRNLDVGFLRHGSRLADFDDPTGVVWQQINRPLIQRVVDATGDFGNVIYEVMNEPLFDVSVGSRAFHEAVVQELRANLAGRGGSAIIAVNSPGGGSSERRALHDWAKQSPDVDLIALHRKDADGAGDDHAEKPVQISNDGDETQCAREQGSGCSGRRVSDTQGLVTRTFRGESGVGHRHFEFVDKGLNGDSWRNGNQHTAPDYAPDAGRVDFGVLAILASAAGTDLQPFSRRTVPEPSRAVSGMVVLLALILCARSRGGTVRGAGARRFVGVRRIVAALSLLALDAGSAADLSPVQWTPFVEGVHGSAAGVGVTITGLLPPAGQALYFVPSDLSGPAYAARPLRANEATPRYIPKADWTVSFSQPIPYLLLYVNNWRSDHASEDAEITYAFSQPFRILSGLSMASARDPATSGGFRTLVLPRMPYQPGHYGILEFIGPISSLSVDSSSQLETVVQTLTFALEPPVSAEPAAWSSPTEGSAGGVGITLDGLTGAALAAVDLSGPSYSFAPLASDAVVPGYEAESDWRIDLTEPVDALVLYLGCWLGSDSEPIEYRFDVPFSALSGLEAASFGEAGTLLSLPGGCHDGIVVFSGPLTSVGVETNSSASTPQVLSVAVDPAPEPGPAAAAAAALAAIGVVANRRRRSVLAKAARAPSPAERDKATLLL